MKLMLLGENATYGLWWLKYLDMSRLLATLANLIRSRQKALTLLTLKGPEDDSCWQGQKGSKRRFSIVLSCLHMFTLFFRSSKCSQVSVNHRLQRFYSLRNCFNLRPVAFGADMRGIVVDMVDVSLGGSTLSPLAFTAAGSLAHCGWSPHLKCPDY